MCSIGGWISTGLDPAASQRITRALVFYGQIRGSQSSGVAYAGRVIKRAMHPDKYIGIRAVRELLQERGDRALTHTRAPTCGGRGDGQAQPFVRANVTSVHNGVISNVKTLIEKFGIDMPSGVDSELITSFVAKHGVLELPKFTAAMAGSAAIALNVGEEMYLIREYGPIEYLTLSLPGGGKLTAFASTEQMLMQALRSHWLLDPGLRTTTLPSDGLYRLTPDGVTNVAPAESRSYAPGLGYRGSGVDRRSYTYDKDTNSLIDKATGVRQWLGRQDLWER